METAPGINDSTNPHRYKSRKLFLAGRSVQSWAVLTGQKGKWQYAADRMANGSMLLTVSIWAILTHPAAATDSSNNSTFTALLYKSFQIGILSGTSPLDLHSYWSEMMLSPKGVF